MRGAHNEKREEQQLEKYKHFPEVDMSKEVLSQSLTLPLFFFDNNNNNNNKKKRKKKSSFHCLDLNVPERQLRAATAEQSPALQLQQTYTHQRAIPKIIMKTLSSHNYYYLKNSKKTNNQARQDVF